MSRAFTPPAFWSSIIDYGPQPAGWATPGVLKPRCHWFPEGSRYALCRQKGRSGHRVDTSRVVTPDECPKCRRMLDELDEENTDD